MREIRKIECSYLYDYVYILVFKNHPVEYMNTYRLETQLESALSSNATVIGEYLIYTFFVGNSIFHLSLELLPKFGKRG